MANKLAVIIDANDKDLPPAVLEEMRLLWREQELGNDVYYFSWYADKELETKWPALSEYVKNTITPGYQVLIHYWW